MNIIKTDIQICKNHEETNCLRREGKQSFFKKYENGTKTN